MKNTLLKIATVLVLGISMFSCSPEDGKDGATGPTGVNGTNGTNGDSNIIFTAWSTRTFTGSGSNWNNVTSFGFITQSIIDSGALLTYKKSSTGDVSQVSNTVTPYFWVYYAVGEIAMEASTNQSGLYRHIIIPPYYPAGSREATKVYSKMSYQEICTKFNITE